MGSDRPVALSFYPKGIGRVLLGYDYSESYEQALPISS
jgi:hypothetical protein